MCLRQALLVSTALLLTGAVVAVAATAGCGSNGSGGTTRTPSDGILTPTTGDLDDLVVSEARVGDEIVVTGGEWTNLPGEPVRFYLLTEDQIDRAVIPSQMVRLGQVMPSEDGTVSFRFRLAESYERSNGDEVRIEAGQRWYVRASQRTEPAPGLSGARGSTEGPLTVVE